MTAKPDPHESMTDAERLIYAAAYAHAAYQGQSAPIVAMRTVEEFRRDEGYHRGYTAEVSDNARKMLREFRGDR